MNLNDYDKRLFGVEDQILRVKILELELPYLWYKNDVGKEFLVIDYRYENTYKAITNEGEIIGYISKKYCRTVEIVEPRKVPEFPFNVKVLKNSWFPQCWYADRIGEIFTITKGGGIVSNWTLERVVDGEKHNSNIQQEDCQILDTMKWFIEFENQEWLESCETGSKTRGPTKALQFESKGLANLYIFMNKIKNCKATEHEFVFQCA